MTDEELFDFLNKMDEEEAAATVAETPSQKRQRLLPHKANAARVQAEIDAEEEEKSNHGIGNAIADTAFGVVSGTPVGSFLDELVGLSGESNQQDFRDAVAKKQETGSNPFIQAFSPVIGAALPFGAAKTVKGAAGIGGLSGLIHGAGNEEGRLKSSLIEGLAGAALGAGGAKLAGGLSRIVAEKNPGAFLEDLVGYSGKMGDKLDDLKSRVSVSPKQKFSLGPVEVKAEPVAMEHPITSSRPARQPTEVPSNYTDAPPILPLTEEPSIGTLSNEQISLARSPQQNETVSLSLEDLKKSAMDDDILFPRYGGEKNWGSEADSPAARSLMQDLMNGRQQSTVPSPIEEGADVLDNMMQKDLDKNFPKITPDEDMVDSTSLVSRSSPKEKSYVTPPPPKRPAPVEPQQSLADDVPEQSMVDDDPDLFSNPGVEEQFMTPQQPQMTPEEFAANVQKLKDMGYDIQSIFAMLEGKQPPPADYMAMANRGSNKPGQARAIAAKEQGTYKPKKKEPKKRPTFNPKPRK